MGTLSLSFSKATAPSATVWSAVVNLTFVFTSFAAVIAVRNNTSNTVFVVPLIRAVESASFTCDNI